MKPHIMGIFSATETTRANPPPFSFLAAAALAPKMNGAKRSAEAVGCKNASVGERSALEGSTRASRGGRSGSENVGLSNANIGENPMPRKPKGSQVISQHAQRFDPDKLEKKHESFSRRKDDSSINYQVKRDIERNLLDFIVQE